MQFTNYYKTSSELLLKNELTYEFKYIIISSIQIIIYFFIKKNDKNR